MAVDKGHGEVWCIFCGPQIVDREWRQDYARKPMFRVWLRCGHTRLVHLVKPLHYGLKWTAPPPIPRIPTFIEDDRGRLIDVDYIVQNARCDTVSAPPKPPRPTAIRSMFAEPVDGVEMEEADDPDYPLDPTTT